MPEVMASFRGYEGKMGGNDSKKWAKLICGFDCTNKKCYIWSKVEGSIVWIFGLIL